jgi:hypothetical protein
MKVISYTERQLLLFISAVISYLVFVNFVDIYNISVAEHQQQLLYRANGGVSFGIYCLTRASLIPLANILSFFLIFIIYYSRNYIFSTLFTLFPILIFVNEIQRGITGIIQYRDSFSENTVYELLLKVASIYDYAVFILLAFLFFWQISILARSIVKHFQAKPFLV